MVNVPNATLRKRMLEPPECFKWEGIVLNFIVVPVYKKQNGSLALGLIWKDRFIQKKIFSTSILNVS